jgi:hypothetical protein
MSINHINILPGNYGSISHSLYSTKNSVQPHYDPTIKKNFHIVMKQDNHSKINSLNIMNSKSNTFTCEDLKNTSPKMRNDYNNNKIMTEKKIIFFDALNPHDSKMPNNLSLSKEFLFKSNSLSPKKKNLTLSKLGEKTYSPTLERSGKSNIIIYDKNGLQKSSKELNNCKSE